MMYSKGIHICDVRGLILSSLDACSLMSNPSILKVNIKLLENDKRN